MTGDGGRERLFTPGPVAVPPEVLEALARPVVHHRTAGFRACFVRVRAALAEVASVPGDDVMIVTGSGTTAFEAALLASVPAGARVLALRGGKFGDRWAAMARAFRFSVDDLDVAWGRAWPEELVRARLAAGPAPDAVTLVHSETSTGVLHDVERIAAVVREAAPDALLLVDAVTSLAAAELEPRAWGLDAVVAGSQKGLWLPPGLGFVWLSERAWSRAPAGRRVPAYALDLHRERPRQREGEAAATPATSLVVAAEAALDVLRRESTKARREGLARRNGAVLAAGRALGARPFAERPSPAVAALAMPDGLPAPDVVRALARGGVRIAGGQDGLAPFVVRPSLLGWLDDGDALALAAALERAWRDLGRAAAPGVAVAAAQRALSMGDAMVEASPPSA